MGNATPAPVPVPALRILIDEVVSLRQPQIVRMTTLREERDGDTERAWSVAMSALQAADRLKLLEDAMDQVAAACIHADVPQQARYAAYDAVLALLSQDLIDSHAFTTLYGPWDAGHHLAPSGAPEQRDLRAAHVA